jgi:hypothetical protein
MPNSVPAGSWFTRLLRERSVQIAIVFWIAASFAIFPLSGSRFPLNRPALANLPIIAEAIGPLFGLAIVFVQMTVTYFLTRRRIVPDMASRAPAIPLARREVLLLWTYGTLVLLFNSAGGLASGSSAKALVCTSTVLCLALRVWSLQKKSGFGLFTISFFSRSSPTSSFARAAIQAKLLI